MCGFLGYFSNKVELSEFQFKHQLKKIDYRGPDYSRVVKCDNVMLGHNRLSILGLNSESNQPMVNKDRGIYLVFNGEIYNYLELKKELIDYSFKTNSDTEIIIAAYCKWGVKFVQKINGMFSIAIYDKRKGIILLVRDHIGKKPLYYSHSNGCFSFGSEVKALTGLPGVGTKISKLATNQYFSTGYIGGKHSIYEDILQLSAGHYAIFNIQDYSSLNIKRYWHLPVSDNITNVDENELVDELDELLLNSIKLRMRSDVPIGFFLSGGLDSSLMVAMASKISNTPLNTFTIEFPNTPNDESEYAGNISSYFSTHHTKHKINEEILPQVPELIQNLDQPFADSSFIPTYYLCKEVVKDVKVALSGDGGDELFAGYGQYDSFAWEDSIRQRYPDCVRFALGRLSTLLPERHRTRSLKRLAYNNCYDGMTAYSSRFFSFPERAKLLNRGNFALDYPEAEFLNNFIPGVDWLQNICQNDFKNYMVDDILVKVDRMSMLNSLEVRSPLLDKKIAEFAFTKVPSQLKIKGGTKKYLLKKLAARYLPDSFPYERKAGFGVPLSNWFNTSFTEHLQDLMESTPSEYINKREVDYYIKMHKLGLSNHSKKLFSILVWEEWMQSKGKGSF
jgi:asparagine synthase (glutamine-hydrolysing)